MGNSKAMYKDYGWKFDEEVAKQFDSHVRQSVFMYEEFHKSIANLSRYFIEEGTNILDVGTSTGELLNKLPYNEKCTYMGIDTELAMVDKAKEKLKDKSKVSIEVGDILTYDIDNCSVITMMLVMQFISQRYRQAIIQRIYDSLNIGGAFFFVDKVSTLSPTIHDIYNDLYYDFKKEKGLSEEEILAKNKSLRGVQKCATLNDIQVMLREVGFKDVDIFLKYNNFVGIIAIK